LSIDLRLHTHYEGNVLTASTITTIYLVLRVVSADLQTSRSEKRHQQTWRILSLLDSYLYNLPSSEKKCNITSIERMEDFK